MNFKEGIMITDYYDWHLLTNNLNIKAIVIQEKIGIILIKNLTL